jgi:co-chaperonin GroES (HSP10)
MRIIPEGRKILVLPIEAKEEQVESIVIPASVAVANLSDAEVIEVSPELEKKYKRGDIISYPSNAGLGQLYNGKWHLWLREELGEIWAIVKED